MSYFSEIFLEFSKCFFFPTEFVLKFALFGNFKSTVAKSENNSENFSKIPKIAAQLKLPSGDFWMSESGFQKLQKMESLLPTGRSKTMAINKPLLP